MFINHNNIHLLQEQGYFSTFAIRYHTLQTYDTSSSHIVLFYLYIHHSQRLFPKVYILEIHMINWITVHVGNKHLIFWTGYILII